jgi:DNA-directed RNA polymerase specialized sigma24 family protein
VHAIGRNKVRELIRNRRRWRRIFEQNALLQREEEEQEVSTGVVEEAGEMPDFDTPILLREICSGLSKEEAVLVECKYEQMTSDEITVVLDITREAVDSRWARLRPKLQKRVHPGDGDGVTKTTNSSKRANPSSPKGHGAVHRASDSDSRHAPAPENISAPYEEKSAS